MIYGGQGQKQFAESKHSVDLSMDSKWYGIPMENQRLGGQGQEHFAESEPSVDLSIRTNSSKTITIKQ